MWRCLKLPEPKRKKTTGVFLNMPAKQRWCPCPCKSSPASSSKSAPQAKLPTTCRCLSARKKTGQMIPHRPSKCDNFRWISQVYEFINHHVAGVTSQIPSQGKSLRLQQKARREETLEPGRQTQSVPLLHPTVATWETPSCTPIQVRTKYSYHHIQLAGPLISREGKTGKHPQLFIQLRTAIAMPSFELALQIEGTLQVCQRHLQRLNVRNFPKIDVCRAALVHFH